MSWPWFWSRKDSSRKDDDSLLPTTGNAVNDISDKANDSRRTPTQWSTAQLVGGCLASGTVAVLSWRFYKRHLHRVRSVEYLKPHLLRKKKLYGYVVRVGDGDNFHFFHTPGGRSLGWGSLRNIPEYKDAKGKTLHVRIAGIDAPELAHFGRPAQPYGKEAMDWLTEKVLNRYVRILPLSKDQYKRVVATVQLPWLGFGRDVGLEMIKAGYATVYEAKFGAEFGDKEEEYRQAEQMAKQKGTGMWQEPGLIAKLLGKNGSFESPREYKTRMKAKEEQAK